ncbi:hypothetical protein CHUAL_014057 [Chamberlinius hualienensis]
MLMTITVTDGGFDATSTTVETKSTAATTTSIPYDFIKLGSKYYYFSDIYRDWQGAFDYCKIKGAKLAYPLNEEENNHIKSGTNNNGQNSWWLGGKKRSDDVWIWSHDNSAVQFTDWANGESNDYGENCMDLFKVGDNWWDDECTEEYHFICQL